MAARFATATLVDECKKPRHAYVYGKIIGTLTMASSDILVARTRNLWTGCISETDILYRKSRLCNGEPTSDNILGVRRRLTRLSINRYYALVSSARLLAFEKQRRSADLSRMINPNEALVSGQSGLICSCQYAASLGRVTRPPRIGIPDMSWKKIAVRAQNAKREIGTYLRAHLSLQANPIRRYCFLGYSVSHEAHVRSQLVMNYTQNQKFNR